MHFASLLQGLTFGFLLFFASDARAIIDGKEVETLDFPMARSLVALQMSEPQADGSIRYYKGSALLIEKDILITAGHNVAYISNAKDVEAIFSLTPCWGVNVCQERRIKARKFIIHPDFDQLPDGTEYDLAIVKLEEDVPSSYHPMELIAAAKDNLGMPLQVLGFGRDRQDQNVPISSYRLRSISLFLEASEYRFGSMQKFWLDQKSGGICGGDSGGPAVYKDGSTVFAVGLAIHVAKIDGKQQCLSKSAFTDFLYFKDWIVKTVNLLKSHEV
jgi:hypothetical protein